MATFTTRIVTFIATLARICPIIAWRVHDANMDGREQRTRPQRHNFIRRPTAAGTLVKRMAGGRGMP
jgi:hypothetical protein